MANYLLLKSTLASATIHYAAITAYQPHPLYTLFLTICLLTSVINHSQTVSWGCRVDRLTISAAVPVTYIILMTRAEPVPLFLMGGPAAAAATYLLSRSFRSVWLHVAAHMLITGCNIGIIRMIGRLY